jgi:hypothetical protein
MSLRRRCERPCVAPGAGAENAYISRAHSQWASTTRSTPATASGDRSADVDTLLDGCRSVPDPLEQMHGFSRGYVPMDRASGKAMCVRSAGVVGQRRQGR